MFISQRAIFKLVCIDSTHAGTGIYVVAVHESIANSTIDVQPRLDYLTTYSKAFSSSKSDMLTSV